MPRVESVKVLRLLWVAFTVNDCGERGPLRYGATQVRAERRAALA